MRIYNDWIEYRKAEKQSADIDWISPELESVYRTINKVKYSLRYVFQRTALCCDTCDQPHPHGVTLQYSVRTKPKSQYRLYYWQTIYIKSFDCSETKSAIQEFRNFKTAKKDELNWLETLNIL